MKLLATLGAFLFSGIVAATPLHDVVVFGDSLSDNGNLYEFMKRQLPQSPPYYSGRFSNGPVWIELLTSTYFPNNLEKHLHDYAYGGAGVSEDEADDDDLFTLRREIKNYLIANNNKADENSLFVIWIGANNYLGMPSEVEKTIKLVNDGTYNSIKQLIQKGAKHFFILNLPDLGRTPAAIEFGSVETMRYFSDKHNETLTSKVEQLKSEYPDVEWVYYDIGLMFSKMLEDPIKFGFTNITGTCSNSNVEENTSKLSELTIAQNTKPKFKESNCDGYLFFDLVHPTALAHKVIADRARVILDEAGVELGE